LRAQVLDGEAMMESMRASISLDPLVTAGWRAMALLSIAIALFAGGTGYVTYLLFFADRSGGEMDLLRSLGLQHRQLIGLLSLEHLVMVLVGIGIGVWAGFQMSTLTVPSVSLSEGSSPILPPVLVTADWWVLGAVCGVLVIGFVQMVLLLNRRIFRSDLQRISRRTEA
jgi:predicted lysophospholipase L1 biosynthesis ABC-type transport system permease subunit